MQVLDLEEYQALLIRANVIHYQDSLDGNIVYKIEPDVLSGKYLFFNANARNTATAIATLHVGAGIWPSRALSL